MLILLPIFPGRMLIQGAMLIPDSRVKVYCKVVKVACIIVKCCNMLRNVAKIEKCCKCCAKIAKVAEVAKVEKVGKIRKCQDCVKNQHPESNWNKVFYIVM